MVCVAGFAVVAVARAQVAALEGGVCGSVFLDAFAVGEVVGP